MSRKTLWVLAMLVGCSRGAAESAPSQGAASPVAGALAEAKSEADAAPSVGQASIAPAAPPAQPRMIVRSAEISMEVADVRRAMQSVSELTRKAEGFLGASRQWKDGESDLATMTLRIPAARLDSTLATLRAMAVRVDNESVTGEDVTRQAVDLSAQLTNLRATETELRALLTTVRQRSQRASDILEVHTQLTQVRGEIETRTAELQSISQLVAMSTVTLTLRPDAVATPIASEQWQPRGVFRDATRALVSVARGAASLSIWALVWAIPIGVVLFGVGKLRAAWRTWRAGRVVGASAR
jgi:Domain of unknown function (DUF4349)